MIEFGIQVLSRTTLKYQECNFNNKKTREQSR